MDFTKLLLFVNKRNYILPVTAWPDVGYGAIVLSQNVVFAVNIRV